MPGGSCFTPTLLAYRAGRRALGGASQDFEADALRRGGCPRFGATTAPLSHVGVVAPSLPAGASPHLPTRRGRWRECCLADRDRRPARPSTGHAARARSRRHTGASVAKGAFWYTS